MFQESCVQPEVTIFPPFLTPGVEEGLSSCRRTQRYCYAYPLRRNQDPAPRLHYDFLTAPPLFLHPLPSLISSCLNLPFGTQVRSRRLNEAHFLQTRNGGHRKICTRESPTGSCSVSLEAYSLQRPKTPKHTEGEMTFQYMQS